MTIGIGGWGSAEAHVARAGDPAAISPTSTSSYGGPDVGILTAAGKCRKVTYGFVSLDSIPPSLTFDPSGRVGSSSLHEPDEGAFYRGCPRVPFYPTRAGLGSAMLENPDLRTVTRPTTTVRNSSPSLRSRWMPSCCT